MYNGILIQAKLICSDGTPIKGAPGTDVVSQESECKEVQENLGMIKCSTSWLWWWFHRYSQLPNYKELYTSNWVHLITCKLYIREKKENKTKQNFSKETDLILKFLEMHKTEQPQPPWKSAVIKAKVIKMAWYWSTERQIGWWNQTKFWIRPTCMQSIDSQ